MAAARKYILILSRCCVIIFGGTRASCSGCLFFCGVTLGGTQVLWMLIARWVFYLEILWAGMSETLQFK